MVLLKWQAIYAYALLYHIASNYSILFFLGVLLIILLGILSYYFYFAKAKAISQLQEKEQELTAIQRSLKDKNEELESYVESNIRLSQFAYVASHDLKSSLNTIKSFTGLLKSTINSLGEKEKEYFDYIEKAAAASEVLVMDTLYYSQVKATPLQLKDVNLPNLLNELLFSLKSVIGTKNAIIEVGQLPNMIVADPKQLRKVFESILLNAIKFIPNNKKTIIHILSEENQREWIFKISDNGIGISIENQDKIFDEFIKLNSKYEYPGSGLGLSISQNIIEKHGGKLWVDASSEKGSTFAFTINKPTTNVSKMHKNHDD